MGKTNRDKNGNYEYDIVVVGSGLAGISAALQALEHDETLSVLLIDENDVAATCGSASSDLDVLLNRATNSSAELREWLGRGKDGAVKDKKGRPYRRLLCMAWPSRNRQKYKRWKKKGKSGTADASEALLKSAKAKEGAKENALRRLRYRSACRAVRLVRGHDDDGNTEKLLEKGDDGAVTGVECEVIPRANGCHRVLRRYLTRLKRKAPRHHGGSNFKQVPPKRMLFRVRVGVVLATGNPALCIGENRPRRDARAQVPASSDLDVGKSLGVELARQTGGAVASVSAYIDGPRKTGSSSPSPVASLAREHMCGIAVARPTGQRFAAEDLHVDVFTKELRRKADGEAFLVLDSKQWGLAQKGMKKEKKKEKRKQEGGGGEEPRSKRTPQGRQHQKAKTLDALAQQIGVDADGLGKAVSAYNEAIRAGRDDAFRKGREYCCTALERAPFYALDISVPSGRGRSPTPRRRVKLLDLIKVDGSSGLVLNEEGRQIGGLYAAGRCATASGGNESSGVAAELYPLTGKESVELGSSADCVASGKKAGRHAASSRKKNVPSNVAGKTAKG